MVVWSSGYSTRVSDSASSVSRQRADEIAAAEFLKVEVIVCRRGPEPQRIDGLAAVANDGAIERNADESRWTAGDRAQGTAAYLERAVELHVHCLVRTRDFPWVRTTEPVVGQFLLPPVLDRLFEDAVFVAQAITHRRDLHRGHGIEEASRQASETSIAQTRVGLLFEQLEPIEVLLLDDFFRDGIEEKVRDIVGQRAADEKFHREIVNALGVLALIGFIGTHPSLRENIAHGAGDGLKTLARADRRCFHNVVKDEVALIKRIVRSGELNRPAAVLLEELRYRRIPLRWRKRTSFVFLLSSH